ncbi:MAG: phage portal protein [Streptomycetaceae bacterium]|nr:phage portal protein [Streptomycetaceae bacterium]
MALADDERALITRLTQAHNFERPQLKAYNDEYEMRCQLAYMHPEIQAELGDRVRQVVIGWPQLVVDSLEERLDVEGFRLPDDDADEDLWRIWQANCADEQSQMATVDALTMRRSYIAIGTNEDDPNTPLVTFESPLEVYADIDPRTRAVRSAIRVYGAGFPFQDNLQTAQAAVTGRIERYATVYEPNQTSYYDLTGSWKLIDRDEHNLGVVPIVPMVNRARLADWRGRSELDPILPLAHAANKIATDMMVAAEFIAVPLRGIFGASPTDFEDQEGNPITPMRALMGRLLTVPDDEKVMRQFEFASAQLSNFHDSINQLAQLVASLAGLPPSFLGLTTEQPPSADAIRASEARLVKRAERKQRAFGGAYERAMRIVRLFLGDDDPKWKQLETIWRDASTPTKAEAADAAVKLHAAGITTLPQIREDLGYTQAQIERMEADDEKAATQNPLADIARGLAAPPAPAEPVTEPAGAAA